MKKILRGFLINYFALSFLNEVFLGLIIKEGVLGLAITAVIMTLVTKFVKPLLNALLLPINILTLGALRWIIDIINLAVVILFVPQADVLGFWFSDFNLQGFSLQGFMVPRTVSLILTAILLTSVKKIIVSVMTKTKSS
jgi:uncharacterized membrane protein YvlD (DUF360 family)